MEMTKEEFLNKCTEMGPGSHIALMKEVLLQDFANAIEGVNTAGCNTTLHASYLSAKGEIAQGYAKLNKYS